MRTVIYYALLLIVANLAVKFVGWTLLITNQGDYTYIDDDFPYEWPIPNPNTILLSIESSSTRFKIQGADADAEWASLILGDGLLHLGQRQRPFTLGMFHQLQCIDILRKGVLETYHSHPFSDSGLVAHCLNYLRQIVICHSDSSLEPAIGHHVEVHPDAYVCNDWESVYREAEKNQRDYEKSRRH
ncbi:hypothetical protein EDD18DRAFT_407467 [Armillaria luteobubalina]|uniref:Uncharacterized protein n=1 Tax=Armillaria luteobubalina TaxID=153913 RepID=A0AA39PZU0_9AGAR|nr:hypothetical protein EDD18DRAFT_407467 [Armillaria luteobubalina]